MRDPAKILIIKSLLIVAVLGISMSMAQAAETQSKPGGQLMFDVEPPLIEHTPFNQPQQLNSSITIEATITDNLGVQTVSLNYRAKGMQNYRVVSMRLTKTNQSVYIGIIPADQVGTETLEYYIQATDTGGNTVLRGGVLFPLSIAIIQPPTEEPKTIAANNTTVTPETTGLFDLSSSKTTWAWIAGGVIVGALIAAAANKDSGETAAAKPTGTISITAGLK